jgi:hypothetical protein
MPTILKTIKYKLFATCLSLLSLFGVLNAQSKQDLSQVLRALQGKIETTIELDKKSSIQQAFQFEADAPWRIQLQQKTTESKGKGSDRSWALNLADLDANTVRWTTEGSHLSLTAKTIRNQKMIHSTLNGEDGAYEESIDIQFSDIAAARASVDSLKKAIKLAVPLWEKSLNLPADLTGLVQFLNQEIKEASAGNEQGYRQSLSSIANFSDRVDFKVETISSKGTAPAINYQFSFGDLSENSIKLQVTGSKIAVLASTVGKQRFIKVEQEGSFKSWNDDLSIYAKDPETAQKIQRILQRIIPLAAALIKARLKTPGDLNSSLAQLKPLIVNIDSEKEALGQTLSGAASEQLTLTRNNNKGAVQTEYRFEWGDLNEKNQEISISGNRLVLTLKTQGQLRFIQIMENGTLQNYANEVELSFTEVEALRQAQSLITFLIGQSKQDAKAQDLTWLQKALGGITESLPQFSQQLSPKSPTEPCEWELTQTETNDKGAKENKYQFGLKDIDPNQVNMTVKGKELFLELSTKFRQKVITRYTDGKAEYQSEFALRMPDVPTLKTAKVTMLKMLEGCK